MNFSQQYWYIFEWKGGKKKYNYQPGDIAWFDDKKLLEKKIFTVDGGMVDNVKNHFNEIIVVVSTELVM